MKQVSEESSTSGESANGTSRVPDEGRQKKKNILRSLRAISRYLHAHAKRVETQTNLNATLMSILWELSESPGLKVAELAQNMVIHPSTCSNLLNKLQKLEMIYRDRSGQDQRQVRLFLTEKGKELLSGLAKPSRGPLASFLEELPDDVLTDLDATLSRIACAAELQDKTK